ANVHLHWSSASAVAWASAKGCGTEAIALLGGRGTLPVAQDAKRGTTQRRAIAAFPALTHTRT
ncbi:hypothetical protein HAX54_047993, partial [Datura stramonium]|nr:hypothetical protein [Datura stramonium]